MWTFGQLSTLTPIQLTPIGFNAEFPSQTTPHRSEMSKSCNPLSSLIDGHARAFPKSNPRSASEPFDSPRTDHKLMKAICDLESILPYKDFLSEKRYQYLRIWRE